MGGGGGKFRAWFIRESLVEGERNISFLFSFLIVFFVGREKDIDRKEIIFISIFVLECLF